MEDDSPCGTGEDYVPNFVSWIEPPRRSHDELDDKLEVDGDGRRLSVLTRTRRPRVDELPLRATTSSLIKSDQSIAEVAAAANQPMLGSREKLKTLV